jgi:hypothetical protein
MASLNTSSRLRNLVSSMGLHTVNLDSRHTRNLELRNMCQLDNNLPTNSIHMRHSSSPSSRNISLMAYHHHLCRLELLRRPNVKGQEHRTRNPASTILSMKSWHIVVTTSAHTPIFNQLRCTKSKRMCLRNVWSGFRSFNVTGRLS